MMKCLAAVAATLAMLMTLIGCSTDAGSTLSVSLVGQPSPIGVVSAPAGGSSSTTTTTNSIQPSIFYRGNATEILLTFNVLEAPVGGSVTITPRTSLLTSSQGVVSPPPVTTLVFNVPGTYVLQVVAQEAGSGGQNISASDQATFIAVAPASN